MKLVITNNNVQGIERDWKDIKVPFHYFQLPTNMTASIDLSKIIQIRLVIDGKEKGTLYLDNIEFYQ